MTVAKDELNVSSWWAGSPDAVLSSLQKQLEAAAVIWPELSEFKINKFSSRSHYGTIGSLGGHARAAALTPEQRTEQASKAAKARWGKPDTESVDDQQGTDVS